MAKTETKTAAKAAKPKAEVKEPRRGVGTAAREAIAAGKTNEEVLAAVKREFPTAKASLASINWYRNKMRSDGEKVPTARELKKQNAPAKEPKVPKAPKAAVAAKASAGKANGKAGKAADPTA